MLAADQDLLESQLKKQAVVIQNQELQFYVSNFDTSATCSSLLAGFCFGGLQLSDFDGYLANHETVIICYYVGVSVAFGSNFLCFILAILSRIQGVGLALKGPAGSMKVAVDQMRKYQQWTLNLLETGLFAFHFSALALAWVLLKEWITILLSSCVLICSAIGTAYLIINVKKVFEIPEEQVVYGTFTSERIMNSLQQHTYQPREVELRRSYLGGVKSSGVTSPIGITSPM
mmetsp:Transcript_40073/g.62703  ORF Transcript_40073/g.62703 Transcript_40073/m.62703 type:complete len:231 (-) Transcript_40073:422-1114(-)|eukprot:CAMPEP_0194713148 /NCGR_PEP_ID=MMETSP0296-20130528/5086_1 /TAXON_ID=39354 /ORGANISM="Heterosigma akashiwo, Strain CCMP2393" /LENGTH=230 /DNA_ID=CAMNT_0039611819 /DNA_START=31 /DNA_END=723 /DNA_ORIENTATION=-